MWRSSSSWPWFGPDGVAAGGPGNPWWRKSAWKTARRSWSSWRSCRWCLRRMRRRPARSRSTCRRSSRPGRPRPHHSHRRRLPTAAAPTIPAKAYPGAPPSAWAGQVQWPPPRCRERRFLDTPSGTPTPTRATTASFLGAEPTSRPFFNLSAMEAESALPSGASTPAPRMVAQHSVDEAGVCTRLPPEGAVHPLSRRQSRPASGRRSRAAGGGSGHWGYFTDNLWRQRRSCLRRRRRSCSAWTTSTTATRSLIPRASTTPAAQGTGRRGRSQRRHGERPATSQDPPPPEPTVDAPPTFRRPLVAAPVPRRGPRRLQVQEPGGGGGATDQEQLPAGTADDQSARDRDSAVRPSAGARRRSVTAAPFRNRLSNEQIAAIEREMTDEYRQHKRAMHKAGARASSYDNPGAVRHLRKQSLADVVDLENRVPGPARSRRRRRSAPIGIRGSCRRMSSGCASPG